MQRQQGHSLKLFMASSCEVQKPSETHRVDRIWHAVPSRLVANAPFRYTHIQASFALYVASRDYEALCGRFFGTTATALTDCNRPLIDSKRALIVRHAHTPSHLPARTLVRASTHLPTPLNAALNEGRATWGGARVSAYSPLCLH